MSASPFRAVFRRQLQSAFRYRTGSSRAQSSSSNTKPSTQEKAASQESASPAPSPVTTAQASAVPIPLWQRLGPLTKAAEAYGRSQRKRPYATQVASAIFIYICADISAQNMGDKEYDPKRTGRNIIIGAGSAIPSYTWFMFLSKNFNYSSRILSLAAKVIINQVFFSAFINTYFFSMQALLAGDGINGAIERVKNTLPTSWVNSWKLWPAVTMISMTFVPMEYRSVFAGVIAMGWQTYLNFLNRKAEIKEAKDHEATLIVAAQENPRLTATA